MSSHHHRHNGQYDDYDIPPLPRPLPSNSTSPSIDSGFTTPKIDPIYDLIDEQQQQQQHQHHQQQHENEDNRLSNCSNSSSNNFWYDYEELKLSRDDALAAILKAEKSLDSACNRLLNIANSKERDNTYEKLIRQAFDGAHISLRELLELCKGSIGCSYRNCAEKSLCKQLVCLLEPVENAHRLITANIQKLDRCAWNMKLAMDVLKSSLIAVRILMSDCSRLVTVLQTNSEIIFASSIADYSNSSNISNEFVQKNNCSNLFYENPDEVISSATTSNRRLSNENEEMLLLPPELPTKTKLHELQLNGGGDLYSMPMRTKSTTSSDSTCISTVCELNTSKTTTTTTPTTTTGIASKPRTAPKPKKNICKAAIFRAFEKPGIVSDAEIKSVCKSNVSLTEKEESLLNEYKPFVEKQVEVVLNYVRIFQQALESNQTPTIFVEKVRQVIVSSQALVHVTDTLSRHLNCQSVSDGIYKIGCQLCDALKTVVVAAKRAALDFPNDASLKSLSNSIDDVSHYVKQVKLVVLHADSLL